MRSVALLSVMLSGNPPLTSDRDVADDGLDTRASWIE
ncbi:MAG: hypothetical protein DVB23_002126 [Verrucomicrobia bacterium]|jgi:hypothetical protein|nr:MAG: hypothetical protein DVB23_002126 [Verrucomicrobiota bacterium]